MSKAECNRAYLKHKNALEASRRIPKVTKVGEIFKRKPYSTSNYTARGNEMSREEVQNDIQYPQPGKWRDMEEVVRCRDCVHNKSAADSGNANCELYYGMTDQTGFCHMGERRDG